MSACSTHFRRLCLALCFLRNFLSCHHTTWCLSVSRSRSPVRGIHKIIDNITTGDFFVLCPMYIRVNVIDIYIPRTALLLEKRFLQRLMRTCMQMMPNSSSLYCQHRLRLTNRSCIQSIWRPVCRRDRCTRKPSPIPPPPHHHKVAWAYRSSLYTHYNRLYHTEPATNVLQYKDIGSPTVKNLLEEISTLDKTGSKRAVYLLQNVCSRHR